MTVRKKIINSSFLLILLFLLVGIALNFEYRYLTRKTAIINKLEKQSVYLQMLLRGLNETALNEGTPDSLKLTRKALNGFDSIHSEFLVKIEKPLMRKFLVEDIDPRWRNIKKEIEPFMENHYLELELSDENVLRKFGALISDTENVIAEIDEHIRYMNEHVMHESKKIRFAIMLSFLCILLVIGSSLYKLYKSITRPIEELVMLAEGLSRGDLSISMDESRMDEFGKLAQHFNKATKKLHHTTNLLSINSQKLSETNAQLRAEIAERKRVQEHMIRAYQLTHEILEKAPYGVYLCNSKGIIEYVNKAMLEISGETHEQFIEIDVYDSPAYNECGLSKKIHDVINGIPFTVGPFEYTSYYGKKTSIRKMYGIPFEEGLDKKALVFVENLTELHETKEELLRARNDWGDTFNTITDIITVHDENYNIIGANEAAQKILNIPDLKIHNNIKCFKQYHGTDSPPIECPRRNCLKTSEPVTFEIFEPHLSTYLEIRSIPRLDENKQLTGLIHVCRDISDRKKDQEMIHTQLNRLKALRSIDRVILGSIDVRIMLDVLVDQIMKQLNPDAVSVLLLNHATNMLEHHYSKGFRTQALKHTKLRLGRGHAGRAAVQRSIISIPDIRENPDGFGKSKDFQREDFIFYCAAPLVAKGEVKGILELFSRTQLEADQDWLEFLEAIADQGAIAIDNATMFDRLQRSNVELSLAYDNTIEGWSRAMDIRDKETEGHSQRVTEMTIRIADQMGIKNEALVHIRRGALLHDMGKLGIPDSILLKPGKLSDEEWVIMKKHPEYAYEMLYPIEHLRPSLDIPYFHHEKWDGTGYPQGLQGEKIPIAARIFAVVDVWDALCSDRPYRPAWPKEKVITHIRSLSGTHFDPEVVEIFFQVNWEVKSGELFIASDSPAVTT